VYFPQVNWTDFNTGKFYLAKSTVTVQNKMTEQIPLFIREAQGLFVQDTTGVTKTIQLKNVFTLKAHLAFDSKQSN
jgi:alpha-glucosidase (family GH31 glycosyl hydrolase)